jgi:hypothetical protein
MRHHALVGSARQTTLVAALAHPVDTFDSALAPCHDVAMPDRKLKIVKFIGSTPNTAYCDVCKLAFRTRREFITDADKAKQQLQSDFEKHECKPEEGAVNDALDHIR